MRRFREDPVDADIIERILEAATRAPSARNKQPWRFIVVRDRTRRAALRDAFRTAYARLRPAGADDSAMYREVDHLAEHMDRAPVIIAVCADPAAARSADVATRYGSVFPAIQNLCLAARAAGLGTVLTTIARREDATIRAAMAIPDDIEIVALIPVGWPDGDFPVTTRRPVREVSYADEWGRPLG